MPIASMYSYEFTLTYEQYKISRAIFPEQVSNLIVIIRV